MAIHTFSFCFFAWFARAWSFRIAADQEQELPWRRAVAVGAMLGSVLPAKAVDAIPEKVDCKNEFYDNAAKALITLLSDYRLVDTNVVEKLVDSLRHSKIVSDDVIQSLDASFRERLDKTRVVVASLEGSEQSAVQQLFFPIGEGMEGVIVMHFLKHYRDIVGEQEVMGMLRSFEMISGKPESAFLRCIAISHTPWEASQDTKSDFMVMLEPTTGSLREVIDTAQIDYWHRFSLFLSVFKDVQLLHDLAIPHSSDINQDTVFLKGDIRDLNSLTAVLSPTILHEKSPMNALDRYNADVMQLGKLLRWLFDGSWPSRVRLKNELILSLGKAMEAGALSGDHVATAELSKVMGLVFSGRSTDADLLATKISYLKLAVNAVRPKSKEKAKLKA